MTTLGTGNAFMASAMSDRELVELAQKKGVDLRKYLVG